MDGGLSVQTLLESGYVVGATLTKTDTQASFVSQEFFHITVFPFPSFTSRHFPSHGLLVNVARDAISLYRKFNIKVVGPLLKSKEISTQ